MLARLLCALVVFGLCAGPSAAAAVTAKVTVSGQRLVVTIKGGKARAVSVVAGGKTYKLSKSGSKWRSKPIADIAALAGAQVKVKVKRAAGGTKTVSATVPGTPLAPAPVAPNPVT